MINADAEIFQSEARQGKIIMHLYSVVSLLITLDTVRKLIDGQ